MALRWAAPDELRAMESLLIIVIANLLLLAGLSSWSSTVLQYAATAASQSTADTYELFDLLLLAVLLTPAVCLYAFAIATTSPQLSDKRVCHIWNALVIGMPLPRVVGSLYLPSGTLQVVFKAIYTRGTLEIIQIALMLAGVLNSVMLHNQPRSYKLRAVICNYAQEFVLLGVGLVRLRGNSVALSEVAAIESWIYYSPSSKYFLLTNFPKAIPFLISFAVTETILHFLDGKWRIQLEASQAHLTEKERVLQEALRLKHENRRLEASKRKFLFKMTQNLERARREKQALLASSGRPGSLPRICETGGGAIGEGACLQHGIIVQPARTDIAPDIERDEKWTGAWTPHGTPMSAKQPGGERSRGRRLSGRWPALLPAWLSKKRSLA
jgi:hypothetical protein